MKTPRTSQVSPSTRSAQTARAVQGGASRISQPADLSGPAPERRDTGRTRAPDIPGVPAPSGGGKQQGFRRLPRMLTVVTAAKQLAVSTKTIRRWIERGDLPVHRFDRSVRIAEDDLTAFLGGCRR